MFGCKYCGSTEFGVDIIEFNKLEVYCKNCCEPVEAHFVNRPADDENSPLAA